MSMLGRHFFVPLFLKIFILRVWGGTVRQPWLRNLTCGRIRRRTRTIMPHARGKAPIERDQPATRQLGNH
jgi:hypothetical protein